MKSTLAILALLGVAAAGPSPTPQGVTGNISPQGGTPDGCKPDSDSKFEITVVKPTPAKRSLEKRAECGGEGTLVLSLAGGKLTDNKGRTGYIASNFQFQFDAPPQAGAKITSGFSLCGNNSVALGPTTEFWQCLSGDFYNLYDRKWAAQCKPVAMQAVPCGAGSDSGSSGSGSSATGGSGATTTAATGPTTPAPAAGGSSPASPPPASELPDGQPNASSAVPVVSELSDGQPNAPTPLVSQISDGQPQATSAPVIPVSQISDGQPQAGNATVAPSPTITPFTGGASLPTAVAEFVALAAGVAAVAML